MPTYNFRCNGCGNKTEDFLKVVSKLEPYLKDEKCKKCGASLSRDYGDQEMNFSMKTFTESDRRDKKFNKNVEKISHENRINKDPYYDVR